MNMKTLGFLCLCVCLCVCAWGKSIFIESENTMGVHRIEGKEGNQVIPVPWTTLGTPDVEPVVPITISNLVSVADITETDEDDMRSFNKNEQVFEGWSWDAGNVYYPGVIGSEKDLDPSKTPIDRGDALWLYLHKDMDVYLIGQASTNAPVSKLVSGTEKRLDNFLANPYDTPVDILGRIEGAAQGDVINVVTATNSVMYWYEKPTDESLGSVPSWCTLETVVIEIDTPRGKKKQQVSQYQPCSALNIPAGAGMWYTSYNTDSDRETELKIKWPRMKGEE